MTQIRKQTRTKQMKSVSKEDVEYKLYKAYREDFFASIMKKSQTVTRKAVDKALDKAFEAGFSDRKIESILNEAIEDTKEMIASWDKEMEEE